MNQFSLHLAHITGYGGVVGVNALISLESNESISGFVEIRVCWKQKSGRLSAAVNAFHMHRGLCSEFTKQFVMIPGISLNTARVREIKKLLAVIVKEAYCFKQLPPYAQWHSFDIVVYSDACFVSPSGPVYSVR